MGANLRPPFRFKAALADYQIEVEPDLLLSAKRNRKGGHDTTLEVAKIRPKVTAAICYNDVVAFGAMAALGELGMRAGANFALIGLDNVLDTAHSNPPLSTVNIDPGSLGEHAADLLLARIEILAWRVRSTRRNLICL